MENNNNELNQEDLDFEQESECLPQYFIPMDLDNLQNVNKYNSKEFKKGLEDMSYTCGKITALLNCGISAGDAMTFILNEKAIEANRIIQEMLNENNIQVSKISVVKVEQQTL